MPIANVQILKVCSKEQKLALIARVSDAILTSPGVAASSVRVVLTGIDSRKPGCRRHFQIASPVRVDLRPRFMAAMPSASDPFW